MKTFITFDFACGFWETERSLNFVKGVFLTKIYDKKRRPDGFTLFQTLCDLSVSFF